MHDNNNIHLFIGFTKSNSFQKKYMTLKFNEKCYTSKQNLTNKKRFYRA